MPIYILLLATCLFAEVLDIRVLRVEFLKENPDNSLTTGLGTFDSGRGGVAYWENHIKFAKNYFSKASNGKVEIEYKVFPTIYKLQKHIIDYNRTSRLKGEKMEAFDSAKAADYARFVNDVLELAKKDPAKPLELPLSPFSKRVILIAHAGANRLIDGGTLGTRGANTPGDFMDAYIDTSWGEFWRGFEVEDGDTITSVIVTSETASQDGLNWGINGTITSQIGRELGLPYSYDVVKGYSRLGYFDGMDFAGYNAGNGFFPSMPSAWMRVYMNWVRPKERNKKDTVSIGVGEVVKIPINHNEYILLENRQRTSRADGKVSIKLFNGRVLEIPVDSLNAGFLDTLSGVMEIDEIDAAIPASGIAAWRINDWYIKELINYGAVNAWNGELYRDHQFGIALIEASGVLGLGKEFKNAAGESVFYFGSGSDLIPHKRKGTTIFSINPTGYANTASTFGGYSGIKITAKVPAGAKEEKSFNGITGDSVVTWRAPRVPIEIEWLGKYARPVAKNDWPYLPSEEDFAGAQSVETGFFSLDNSNQFKGKSYNLGNEKVLPIYADINNDGIKEAVFLGNNRLYVVDTNGVPLPNFPVLLSNGEPFSDFNSKPMAIDIDSCGLLEILIPVNNGLILGVNNKGKLLREEFPIAAGTFFYEDSTRAKFPMLLYKHIHKDSTFLFALHRDSISAFFLPGAKEFVSKSGNPEYRDEITEFFIFPNPVRKGKASMRFRILNKAASATLDIFDITGFRVFRHVTSEVNYGSNQIEGLDLSKLGSDVYSARLTVKFAGGAKKEKWVRIGVIR